MSDRTNCTLDIRGIVDRDTWAEIEEIIADELAPTYERDAPLGYIHLEEINFGELPDEVDAKLRDAGLSYVWCNEVGGGYEAEIRIYDAVTQKVVEYLSDGGDTILVTVKQAETPSFMTEARYWQDFVHAAGGLTIV